MIPQPPRSTHFPYTTLFRSLPRPPRGRLPARGRARARARARAAALARGRGVRRSEEHTSELQSRLHLVCRLLLEKNNIRSIFVRLYTSQVYTIIIERLRTHA